MNLERLREYAACANIHPEGFKWLTESVSEWKPEHVWQVMKCREYLRLAKHVSTRGSATDANSLRLYIGKECKRKIEIGAVIVASLMHRDVDLDFVIWDCATWKQLIVGVSETWARKSAKNAAMLSLNAKGDIPFPALSADAVRAGRPKGLRRAEK